MTSMVLVVLLLGNAGEPVRSPLVMLASVIGLVTAVALDGRSREALAEIDAEPARIVNRRDSAGPSPA